MKFSTKRALSLLVAVCMLVAMLPAGLISASAANVGTVYSYKFAEAVHATVPSGVTTYIKDTAFATDYQASQDANVGSAKWKFVSGSNVEVGNQYNPVNQQFGIFGFNNSSGDAWERYQIEIPETAQYKLSFTICEYASCSPVNVYLAPVSAANPMSPEYLVMETNNSGLSIVERTIDVEGKQFESGDYYLTFKQSAAGYRYLTHKAWTMEVTGEFDENAAPEIVAATFDKTELFLGMDSLEFLTPTVLPAEADTGDIVFEWASSDENVVIVDEGLVLPIGPGFATVTATTENGKTATAYVLVTDSANFRYDFTKGYTGPYSSSWVAPENVTFGNTMMGHPLETHLHANNIAAGAKEIITDPWAYYGVSGAGGKVVGSSSMAGSTTAPGIGAQNCGYGTIRGYNFYAPNAGDAVSFVIKVPTEGVYTPSVDYTRGSGYGSGNFYLAPIDADDPLADEYLLGNVSFAASALTDHCISEFDNIELTAGDYIVSLAGPGCVVTFWTAFALTNPNTVKEVNFIRDSLKVAVGQTASAAAIVSPETAPDKSLTFTSSDETVATVDEETGAITGISEGTAIITATSVADSSKSDTITINVGGKVFYYDFMKSNGFGLVPSKGNDKYLKDAIYSQDFKYTTSGSADEVALAYESNGWKIGPVVNSSDWTWSESAIALGLFINLNNASAENGYASINIDVPVAGTYDVISVHSLWTAGTTADYYLAPASAANPIDAQYKVNTAPVNHKTDNGTNYTTEAVVGQATVSEAGEYVLTLYSDAQSMIFIRGIRLSDAEVNVPVESITLSQSGIVSLVDGETLEVSATVLPANATDKTYTLTSSNTSVAAIVDGAVVPVGAGIATITATANDGSGATDSFDVMCNMTLKYTYEFRDTMATMYNTSSRENVSAPTNAFGESYAKSESLGSAPWMYAGSSNGYEYFDYTSSSYGGFGVFGLYNQAVGYWNSLKIRVDEGAKYTGMLRVSDWTGSYDYDIYLAPVYAADRVAEQYKVGSYTISGGTNHGVQVALDTMDMPAGEYYLSFQITKANAGAVLIGVWDLELYYSGALAAAEAVALEATTANGASIRTTGVQGLRFVSSLKKNADFDKVVEYGTVLIPTAYLGGDDLVIGYKAGKGKVAAKVPAKFLYTDTEEEVSFTAVLTNIAPANYTREISARAYAIYEDANGDQYVVYGDVTTSRSPYTVALNGLANENATEEEKAVFQAIVDAVEAQA